MGLTDSFKGQDLILLQPGDVGVPYSFHFTVCSASTRNDGALPYGEIITTFSASAHTEAGTATTAMIDAVSFSSYTGILWLSYPTSQGAGRYHLTFLVTLSATSQVMEFDFNRVVAKNM